MKKMFAMVAVLAVASQASAALDVIRFDEGFETAGGDESFVIGGFSPNVEASDGFGDFFTTTDGTSNIGTFVEYSGADGDFFAAMDIDAGGAGDPNAGADNEGTLTWTGIDISGLTDLMFSGDFAEDDDGTDEDWDIADFVHIDYQIDGGGYQNLLWFESIPDGDAFNAVPAVDSDFDGTGDGTTLTDTFSTFMASIGGTGSLLDLRVTFSLDSGDEDIALDNLLVGGAESAPVVPEPTMMLVFAGLATIAGLQRVRS